MVRIVDADWDWTDYQQVEFNGEVSPENIMGYDGFLGYIDENEPVPDNIRGCIDSFLAFQDILQI